jgi:RNA exonuclease 1
MKRSQEFSPATASQAGTPPVSKKLKVSPRESNGISTPDQQDVLTATGNADDGWTKVEKRKAKKTKKMEGKLDVCISTLVRF